MAAILSHLALIDVQSPAENQATSPFQRDLHSNFTWSSSRLSRTLVKPCFSFPLIVFQCSGAMVIKVHGVPVSAFTGTVLITLWEKDTDFELVTVDMAAGAHKQLPHLAKQPFGKVPYIEDGDLELFESRAIVRHIADRFAEQGTDVYPQDPKARGAVNQWMEVEAQSYSTLGFNIALEKFYAPRFWGRPGDEAKAQENLKKLEEVLDIYEAQLSKHKYLAGDFFSLADIAHIAPTFWLKNIAPELALSFRSRQHVQAWWEDITSRGSAQKYWELAGPAYPKIKH